MNNSITGSVIVIVFMYFGTSVFCQSGHGLLFTSEKDSFDFSGFYSNEAIYVSEADVQLTVKEVLSKLRSSGFLAASVDSFFRDDSIYVARCFIGNQYKVAKVGTKELDWWVYDKSHILRRELSNRTWSSDTYSAAMEQILERMANAGYPFASVYLDSIRIQGDEIRGNLQIDRGEMILFDTLELTGDLNISKSFLRNYLGIKPSDPYNHSVVLNVEEKLRQLGYVVVNEQANVSFFENKAVVGLDLSGRRNSQFDFLIGVLPSSQNGRQNLEIALDLTTEMYNKLGAGEYFYAQIQRFGPENQELTLEFNYPYLLQLPVGADLRLEIYRNADLYLDVDFDLGWQYIIRGRNQLNAFWNIKSSRLIDVDSSQILASGKLPDRLDIRYSAGGLRLQMENFDYRFNPRKGNGFGIEVRSGIKKIIKNTEIESLRNDAIDFSQSYDTLNLNSFQFQIKGQNTHYFPLGVRSTLLSRFQTGLIISENRIFENEMFRIGGSRILRGFDEESILTNFYGVFTVEYRMLIGRNSFFSVFVDQAVLNNELFPDPWDYAAGIGAGLSLETRAGIFSISTAIGQRKEEPFNLRNAKVHFGYLSLF